MSEIGPTLEPTVRAESTPDQNAAKNPAKAVRRVFKSKPPEVIKAQIAAFTAQTVPNLYDRKHVFSNLSKLAEENPESVTRTTTDTEYDSDENGKTLKIPAGTERLIATNEEYLQYLRSVSGSRFEPIKGRADILATYSQYSTEITKLKDELADPAKRKDHPAFLGSGSNSTVFRITRDGKDYAVRVPNGKETNPLAIDSHLAGAILGRGIPHLEQIVAASYEDGTTVAEMMPGKEIGNLSISEIDHISDSQLNELVDTVVIANKRGILIDPKPSNFFYDPEAGFGIVDYHSSKDINSSAVQKAGAMVGQLAAVISNAGFYGKRTIDRTAEEYSASLAFHQVDLRVLRRLRDIVEGKLQGDDLSNALQMIDLRIKGKEDTVMNHSDPAWVSEQVKADEDSRRTLEQQRASGVSPKQTVDIVW